jgi:hypothetical protein
MQRYFPDLFTTERSTESARPVLDTSNTQNVEVENADTASGQHSRVASSDS